jgi:hypothetical protein
VDPANGTNGVEQADGHEDEHVFDEAAAPRAPGMKYRHYAPQGRLILFSRDAFQRGALQDKLAQLKELQGNQHINIGIISRRWGRFAGLTTARHTNGTANGANGSNGHHQNRNGIDQDDPVPGSHSSLGTAIEVSTLTRSSGHSVFLHEANLGPDVDRLAHELFYILRKFDELGCHYIFAELVEPELENEESGEGSVVDAVIDRIEKASSERIE